MSETPKTKWWSWVLIVLAVAAGVWLIANWAEFSAGFADGFNRPSQPRP